jgi:hypothetical protein
MKLHLLLLALMPLLVFGQTQKASDRAYLHYTDGEYDKSFQEFSQLAKFDNGEDYYSLALHYYNGLGVEKNIDEAIKYFRKAAENGHKDAQAILCEIYKSDKDYNNLYRYCRMYGTNTVCQWVRNANDDDARYDLYLCYKNGWGTVKNAILAEVWLSFAVEDECYDAAEEYCKTHNLNFDDYDTDEAYEQLKSTCFNHICDLKNKIIGNDSTLESAVFNMWNDLNSVGALISDAINIYTNYTLPFVAEAGLYRNALKPAVNMYLELKESDPDMLDQMTDFKTKMEPIIERVNLYSDDYELVSDDEITAWFYRQLILEMWKFDTILNGTTNKIRQTNNIEWVDLGLPSGTKWASHNLISDERNLFAWGETAMKAEYSESNYVGDMTQPLLNAETDVATLQCGQEWSTPSVFDWYELDHYCKCEFDDSSGSVKYTSPNGNSILLPLYYDSEHEGCFYWTKSKNTHTFNMYNNPADQMAIGARFYSNPLLRFYYTDTWHGCLIRPVLKIK